MENTETAGAQAGAEEPTAPQKPSEALSKEDAMDFWECEKEERGIEGKPDLSHITAGLCRCLKLSQERDRKELKRAVQSWADQCGLDVGERTIRNWVNGRWTEEAAAVAVLGACVTILGSNRPLRETAFDRTEYQEPDMGPIWFAMHPEEDLTLKAAREVYRVAFELCVFGKVDGAERNELLASALFKVCGLSNGRLRALNGFLDAFTPRLRADEPETISEMVGRVFEELGELNDWAIQVDEASGEGSYLIPTLIPIRIIPPDKLPDKLFEYLERPPEA